MPMVGELTSHVEQPASSVERHRRYVEGQGLVRQLMSELLFYGWGVRTLAVGEGPLRAMLGLESVGQHLVPEPALPSTIGPLELLDIPGRWGCNDAFARGRVDTSPMDRTR